MIPARPLTTAFALAVAAALIACLTGCTADPNSPVLEAGCRFAQVSAAPLRADRDYLLLPASLDGQAAQMILDTGSEISTLTPRAASRLGLVGGGSRVLEGVGGSLRSRGTTVPAFSLAGAPPASRGFSIAGADLLPDETPPVTGILGADILGGNDIDLDAPRGQFGAYSLAACPNFLPWRGATGTNLARTATGLDLVVATVDGRATRALIDTGARFTFMTRRLARALGISDEVLAGDDVTTAVGISRSTLLVHRHVVPSIALGPTVWRDVPVFIADVKLRGIDLLLGADLLRRQRVWISPYRGMIWLR